MIKWFLVEASAPSELDTWVALARLDTDGLDGARKLLDKARSTCPAVSELRLNASVWWFTATTLAELLPCTAAELDGYKVLGDDDVAKLTDSEKHERTEGDELVLWAHDRGASLHWVCYPHGSESEADNVCTSLVDWPNTPRVTA
jgi:hypothetical protein